VFPGGKDDSQSSIVTRPVQDQVKPAVSTTSPTKPVTGRSKPSTKATVGAKGKDGQDGASAVTTSRQTTTGNQGARTKAKNVGDQASNSASKPRASEIPATPLPASPPPKRNTNPSTPKKTVKTTINDNVVNVNGQRISVVNQNTSRGGSSSVSIGSAGQSVSVSSGTNGRQISINNGQVTIDNGNGQQVNIDPENGQIYVGDNFTDNQHIVSNRVSKVNGVTYKPNRPPSRTEGYRTTGTKLTSHNQPVNRRDTHNQQHFDINQQNVDNSGNGIGQKIAYTIIFALLVAAFKYFASR
jgi:hypothetical protein